MQHPSWDHKKTFAELIAEHTDCLLDPNYKPHEDDEDCLPVGSLLLPQADGSYTQLAFAKRGWMYISDAAIGAERMNEYKAMLTSDAVRLIEATAISIRA